MKLYEVRATVELVTDEANFAHDAALKVGAMDFDSAVTAARGLALTGALSKWGLTSEEVAAQVFLSHCSEMFPIQIADA